MLAQPLLELVPERLWVCRDENANSGQLGLLLRARLAATQRLIPQLPR
jgi:hypothetical protein